MTTDDSARAPAADARTTSGASSPQQDEEHTTARERDLERRLHDLATRYRALTERLPAVTYVDAVDAVSTNLYTSPQVKDILGYTREEWMEDPDLWVKSLHPEDRERTLEANEESNRVGEPFREEYRLIASDGRVVWIRDEAVMIRDDDDKPLYWQGVQLDITEIKEAEQELRETHARYQTLVEQIPAIVYIDLADENLSTIFVSPQIKELLGITPEEYIEDPDLWYKHLHPDDRERALGEILVSVEEATPLTHEYRLIARDGRVVWFRDSSVRVPGDGEGPDFIHGVMLDITEQKAAEEKITYLAYHDKLTGLPNRVMFEELLGIALARARRHDSAVAVLSVDLDNFKLVNDSLGHEVGDQILGHLAERLGEATRETDLVARQGGDEFLLLLADLERDKESPVPESADGALLVAESIASRVHESLREPFNIADREIYLTASIGIALFPMHGEDATSILKSADTAMFKSKSAGPGGYVVFATDDADALTKLSLTTRLRKAVEGQTWVLHYQPIIDLAEGEMVGVEALLRWQDPNGGLIPPGDFIPLAEEMGLIEVIGDWVVEEMARQDQEWRAEGLELELGFNLSPRQLWRPDVTQKIMRRLEAAGVDPRNVVVEITESTAMADPDRTQHILWELHSRGLQIAIDDFGTGYSSLSRLKHLPVDILKIDRMFVREVDQDPQAGSMVQAIVQLARSLEMVPLAEGIETESEWKFLTRHGCTRGQGFHFSRPVPGGEILARYRRAGMSLVLEEPAS